jgi:uncharacterized SAM-binding protein YcdF (DUF218 family)
MSIKFLRKVFEFIGILTTVGAVTVAVTLPFLAHWLQPNDTPEPSEYIVVLAGDEHRYLKAAELYQQKMAPVILLSNEYVPPLSRIQKLIIELGYPYLHPYEFRQRVLEHLGIPKEALVPFGTGNVSTLEEAEALKQLLGDRQVSAILVTSPFQARRAKLTFESVMPRAHFLVVSPPERTIDGRWWRDQQSALLTVLEIAKIAYFWAGGAFHTYARTAPR